MGDSFGIGATIRTHRDIEWSLKCRISSPPCCAPGIFGASNSLRSGVSFFARSGQTSEISKSSRVKNVVKLSYILPFMFGGAVKATEEKEDSVINLVN